MDVTTYQPTTQSMQSKAHVAASTLSHFKYRLIVVAVAAAAGLVEH